MVRYLVLVVALVLASPALSQSCNRAPGGSQGIASINQLRGNAGLRTVAEASALTAQAQKFACDMARRGYFSHVSPEGQGFQARLRAAGLPGGCGAENIAFSTGSGGASGAISQWLGSPPHKRNMLGRKYSVAGLAGASGGGRTIWVLLLGNCK